MNYLDQLAATISRAARPVADRYRLWGEIDPEKPDYLLLTAVVVRGEEMWVEAELMEDLLADTGALVDTRSLGTHSWHVDPPEHPDHLWDTDWWADVWAGYALQHNDLRHQRRQHWGDVPRGPGWEYCDTRQAYLAETFTLDVDGEVTRVPGETPAPAHS